MGKVRDGVGDGAFGDDEEDAGGRELGKGGDASLTVESLDNKIREIRRVLREDDGDGRDGEKREASTST